MLNIYELFIFKHTIKEHTRVTLGISTILDQSQPPILKIFLNRVF